MSSVTGLLPHRIISKPKYQHIFSKTPTPQNNRKYFNTEDVS